MTAAAPTVAEPSLAEIAAAGRAAWPEVDLPDAALAAHLAARRRDDPDGAVHADHAADYYLAAALAQQLPAAMRVFEARLVPEIDVALGRLRLPRGADDEVKQALRVELLVGDGAPRIADYGGRGALAAWLRITATRKALKLVRRAGREETLDELLLEHWPDATPGPAGRHLRATYAAELKRAVTEALGGLPVRQRNLLRQHVLDGLTIDELAGLYRVHRATCARWLADARGDLARGTRRALTASLGLHGDELDSMLRLLDSDIELSLSRLLRAPAPEGA
ncbi:MAG: transcriptional regulator [Myxococcales bacterium]|nr:transcriptional regulator [Myxococcales bacterium]